MLSGRCSVIALGVLSVGWILASSTPIAAADTAAIDNEGFARNLCEAIIKSAHPTGERVSYLSHVFAKDAQKPDRCTLTMTGKYYGALSNTRYGVNITVTFRLDTRTILIQDIAYSDDNKHFGANWRNIQKLQEQLNQKLNE